MKLKKSATAVVFSEDSHQALLILRGILHTWSLPGGGIESGETPEQAALRETLEETGYLITTDRYVGEYNRSQLHDRGTSFPSNAYPSRPPGLCRSR
jgi:8-oxo-dGTP pyrophosphatase MutT (NUDIX family)